MWKCVKTWKIAEILRTKFRQILENREILSYFDVLALSRCILYFDILLVFRILILNFSRFRTQVDLADRSTPLRGIGFAVSTVRQGRTITRVTSFRRALKPWSGLQLHWPLVHHPKIVTWWTFDEFVNDFFWQFCGNCIQHLQNLYKLQVWFPQHFSKFDTSLQSTDFLWNFVKIGTVFLEF